MPAKDRDVTALRKLVRLLLSEGRSVRGHIDKLRALLRLAAYLGEAVEDRLRLHYHTEPAAVWVVVGAAVLIRGEIADVERHYADYLFALRPADYAVVERSRHEVREKRHNIKLHMSNNPSNGLMSICPPATSTEMMTSGIAGTSSSRSPLIT